MQVIKRRNNAKIYDEETKKENMPTKNIINKL